MNQTDLNSLVMKLKFIILKMFVTDLRYIQNCAFHVNLEEVGNAVLQIPNSFELK